MLKVYGIHGRTTALIRIPVGKSGKAFLECEFARGRMGAGPANRPAVFVTGDPIKQEMIENSPQFASGAIKIVRQYADEAPAPQPAAPAAAPKKVVAAPKPAAAPATTAQGVTVVDEVASREEAVAYLKAHGAKATNLKDDDAIRAYMAKIGVSFPNASL